MRHPEEGEIHAWLDGALAADDAARIEAHVAGCARCAADVATARGLIAGASRILLALDGVPGGVIPAGPTEVSPGVPSATPAHASEVAELRFRPTKAAGRRHVPWFSRPWTRIAAGLVLAAGIGTVATRRDADESNQVTIELRGEPVELTIPSAGSSAMPDTFGAAGLPSAASDAAGAGTPGSEVTRRAAVAVPPPPTALPPDRVGSREAAAPLETRTATNAKARQGTPGSAESRVPAPAPSVPASQSAAVREEARERGLATGGAAGGSGSAGAQAATPVLADSARAGRDLRLQSVVVTSPAAVGRASPPPIRMDSLAPSALNLAGRASLSGSCYALDLAAPAELARGDMPLPATMRIRLADLQNISAYAPRGEAVAANAQVGGIQLRAPARAARSQPPAAAAAAAVPEPIETVEWQSVARDSVVARRLAGVDVIVFRLAISGDEVTGTARAETATTPPARVTGRRIACDGSF